MRAVIDKGQPGDHNLLAEAEEKPGDQSPG